MRPILQKNYDRKKFYRIGFRFSSTFKLIFRLKMFGSNRRFLMVYQHSLIGRYFFDQIPPGSFVNCLGVVMNQVSVLYNAFSSPAPKRHYKLECLSLSSLSSQVKYSRGRLKACPRRKHLKGAPLGQAPALLATIRLPEILAGANTSAYCVSWVEMEKKRFMTVKSSWRSTTASAPSPTVSVSSGSCRTERSGTSDRRTNFGRRYPPSRSRPTCRE
jgi:hypothetical protein